MLCTEGEVSIASTQSTETPVNQTLLPNPYHQEPHDIPTFITTSTPSQEKTHNYHTRNDLRNWLTQSRQTRNPAKSQPNSLNVQTIAQQQPITHNSQPISTSHQQTLQRYTDNNHWGDQPPEIHPKIFTIISRNANTISTQNNLLKWRATAQALFETNANIACIQEPNVNWSPMLATRIQRIFQQQFGKAKIATSSSLQANLSEYQPGGTVTISIGSSTSRLITTYDDPHGMGRWSTIALRGKLNKTLVFISAYRVCNQAVMLGSQKAYTQQHTQLIQASHENPDPHKWFIMDLIKQIQQWQQQHYKILLCMDANENMARLTPTNGIGHLIHETGLVNLHKHRQPRRPTLPTYNRGTNTIDACLRSTIFVQALTAAWYLPFGSPVTLPGDHRLLGLAFDMDILFGHKLPDPTTPQQRGVNSNTKTTVKRFSKMVVEGFLKYELFDKIYALAAQPSFMDEDHNELELIDEYITLVILKADKQCRRLNQAPWSADLHHAYLQHRYWVLQLSEKKTGRNFQQACAAIVAALPSPIDTTGNISTNLMKSRTRLREVRWQALQKRKDFLQTLATAAHTAGKNKKGRLIQHLLQAEQNR